jgi:hypothetical protein
VVSVKIKTLIAWAVVLAVLVIFFLGLGPVGNFSVFGASGIAGILATLGFFFTAGVAAVVAIYWGRE